MSVDAMATMRQFLDRQSDKVREIEGSIAWRNGYGAALDAMTRVLNAIENRAKSENVGR